MNNSKLRILNFKSLILKFKRVNVEEVRGILEQWFLIGSPRTLIGLHVRLGDHKANIFLKIKKVRPI